MTHEAFTSIKSLLDQWIVKNPDAKDSLAYMMLWTRWPDVVGDNLSDASAPYKVEEDTLYVYVKDGMTAQSLTFAFPHMAERIRSIVGHCDLKKLRTRMWTGPTPLEELFVWKKKDGPPPPPFMEILQGLSEDQQLHILRTLRPVKDTGLKEALLHTWVRSLAQK